MKSLSERSLGSPSAQGVQRESRAGVLRGVVAPRSESDPYYACERRIGVNTDAETELLAALEEMGPVDLDLDFDRSPVEKPEAPKSKHTYIDEGFKCPTCGKQDVWLAGAGWRCHTCNQTGRITFFRDRGFQAPSAPPR